MRPSTTPSARSVRRFAQGILTNMCHGRRHNANTTAALAMRNHATPSAVTLEKRSTAIDQLDRLLDSFLLYGSTTTTIIQSSPVPLRPPPLPEDALLE